FRAISENTKAHLRLSIALLNTWALLIVEASSRPACAGEIRNAPTLHRRQRNRATSPCPACRETITPRPLSDCLLVSCSRTLPVCDRLSGFWPSPNPLKSHDMHKARYCG